MEKPTEYQIECYAREPESFSRNERYQIETWIEKDEEISLLYQWYREFFRQVFFIEAEKEHHPDKPTVVLLKPCIKKNNLKNHFVLAAQTPEETDSVLRSVKTFISEDELTLLRILHDRDKHRTHLHIISDHLDPDDIVMIESMKEKEIFISRPGGKLDVPDSELSSGDITGWESCAIHLPLYKVLLYKDIRNGSLTYSLNKKNLGIELTITDKTVQVTFSNNRNHVTPTKIILRTENSSKFYRVQNNVCEIAIHDVDGARSQLSFYH